MDKQDHDLIIGLKQGSIKSYEVLFHKYYASFHAFALGLVKDESTAEDIVQNVFMKLWIYRDRLNEELSLHNYLFVLTKHEVYNNLRLKSNFQRYQTRIPMDSPAYCCIESSYNVNEIRRIVDRTVESMPPQRQKIFRMSREEHMPNREIALKLGLSIKTIEKHIELALKQIRENMPEFLFLLFLLFC